MFFFQDIVEGADKPNLTDNSATFDRFGFRIDTSGNSLEDKAEKLRKQAEDHHDQLDEGACQVKSLMGTKITLLLLESLYTEGLIVEKF